MNNADNPGESTCPPKRPLLDSVGHIFEQNRLLRQQKEEELCTKREVEKAHSQYIQKNVVTPQELARAALPVSHFAKKHGIKNVSQNASMRGGLSPRQQNTATSSLNNLTGNRSSGVGNQLSHVESSGAGNQSTGATSKFNNKARNQSNSRMNTDNNINQSNGSNSRNRPIRQAVNTSNIRSSPKRNRNSSVIELNSSLDDSDIEIVNLNDSQYNQCNNCDTSKDHVCSVLNCEAKFSSQQALGQHQNLFKHSPCNPCLKARDCKLLPDILCYVCPDCDREFAVMEDCQEHMRSEKHSAFLPPLQIAAYMCPQCLHMFENFELCWNHIEQSSHQNMCYPFSDDHTGGAIGPVAVPEALAQDFIHKCNKVPYTMQCLECSMLIETAAELRNHYRETNNQHIVSSLTESSLVDVFAGYLSRYSCGVCHRLFNRSLTELAEHQCATGILGKVEENDTRSFSEFVKRCALSLMKSIERKPDDIPGTSLDAQRGKGPMKRIKSQDGGNAKSKKITAGVKRKKSKTIVLSDSEDENETRNLIAENVSVVKPDIVQIDQDMDDDIKSIPANSGPKRKNMSPESDNEKTSKTKLQKNGKTNENEEDESENKMNTSGNGREEGSSSVIQSQTNATATRVDETGVNVTVHVPSTVYQPTTGFEVFGGADMFSQTLITSQTSNRQHGRISPILLATSLGSNDVQVASVLPNQGNHQSRYSLRHPAPLSGPFPVPSHALTDIGARPLRNSQQPGTSGLSGIKADQGPGTSRQTNDEAGENNHQFLQAGIVDRRDRSRSPLNGNVSPNSTENLTRMRHIIFLDLDNWPAFFSKLPRVLPDLTFVWGFYGGRNTWREPRGCYVFNEMKKRKLFHLHERCGFTKDAADFAIVLTVGTMHERLPKDIAFTIVSGDKGFLEVERQMRNEKRRAVVIDPHSAQRSSNDMIYIMVNSVIDT